MVLVPMALKDHDKGVYKRFPNGYFINRAEKPDPPRSGLVQFLLCILFNYSVHLGLYVI